MRLGMIGLGRMGASMVRRLPVIRASSMTGRRRQSAACRPTVPRVLSHCRIMVARMAKPRASAIGSWLLDLIAGALQKGRELKTFGGRVADSGEGRWTI